MDQPRRQMEVIFYSWCCIMGSRVGILASKIRLAMKVVVESWITYYRLDHMVWPSNLHWMDQVFLIRETFFSLKCICLGASLNTLCNFYWKLHFPAIYNIQNYKIFCPSGSIIVVLQMTLKLVNFYHIIFHDTTLKISFEHWNDYEICKTKIKYYDLLIIITHSETL